MLTRRKIELRPNAPGLPHALITRQTLIDCGQAHALLARAQRMADELLGNAQQASDIRLEQAQREFWQHANAQLESWQREHGAMRDALESCATLVVNQALRHLLDDIPQPAQIGAMLKQLLSAQCPPLSATLRCHPQAHETVRQWLSSSQANTLWQLQSDERLDVQALVLVTAQGDLRLAWPAAVEMLLLPVTTHGTDLPVPATDWSTSL